uniref:hypothetical protein n=1 Tax=Cupriavidus yeoncheonensis TaxID=1462994 RepID=UPI003F49302D
MSKRKLISIFVCLATVVSAVALTNYLTLIKPLTDATQADIRNEGIEVRVHYRYYVDLSKITFDLREVKGNKAPVDVMRVLFQFAAAVKDKNFKEVTLAHKGAEKFRLNGNFFQNLGKEFGKQNPIYTIRTLPENVQNLDGSPAFGKWTGGWLGVMGKQMEDVTEFHHRWYMQDGQ